MQLLRYTRRSGFGAAGCVAKLGATCGKDLNGVKVSFPRELINPWKSVEQKTKNGLFRVYKGLYSPVTTTNHYFRIPMTQPGFNGKLYRVFLVVAQLIFRDLMNVCEQKYHAAARNHLPLKVGFNSKSTC